MNGVIAHLRSLGTFGGREGRGAFWPYAGCVIAFVMAASWAAMLPTMNQFFANAERLAAEDPGAVRTEVGPSGYSIQVEPGHPEILPNFDLFFGVLAVTVIVAVGLLAAAVSRRLHDSGLRGYWGLLPLPFLATGLAVFPMLIRDFQGSEGPDMRLFLALFLNNFAYIGALGTLILLLCRGGTDGPNRFGANPKG